MTKLLQRMRDELVRRNYSATTIRTYLHALNTCRLQHPGRRLDQLGPRELRRYQASLFEERKLAVGTVGLHVAALRFFYVRVLKRWRQRTRHSATSLVMRRPVRGPE